MPDSIKSVAVQLALFVLSACLPLAALGATADAASDAPASAASGANAAGLPNQVDINAQLTTSGQPTAEQLGNLAAQGYEAVIYLAPPNVGDAVREEPLIVGKQGLVWINIPVRFGNPNEKDFETFAAMLTALGSRKVLVHCQVNMRASSMVFLYRTLIKKEDPHKAYDAVTRIWVPNGPWKTLVQAQLKKHGVQFDPF